MSTRIRIIYMNEENEKRVMTIEDDGGVTYHHLEESGCRIIRVLVLPDEYISYSQIPLSIVFDNLIKDAIEWNKKFKTGKTEQQVKDEINAVIDAYLESVEK